MRKLVLGLALIVLVYQLAVRGGVLSDDDTASTQPSQSSARAEERSKARAEAASPAEHHSASASEAIAQAYEEKLSGIQVQSYGVVQSLLRDDNEGSRHQRFIVRLSSGQTVLVAHNIDLAPRIATLREGDAIAFSGEYEWNEKGGVIHWTHRDPAGRHKAGWLKHDGRVYQ